MLLKISVNTLPKLEGSEQRSRVFKVVFLVEVLTKRRRDVNIL